MILVDTNVLGRLCHANDPLRLLSMNALRWCRRQQETVVIFPQTLYEFWVIATRPADVNGLAMSVDRALRWLLHFQTAFAVLRDPQAGARREIGGRHATARSRLRSDLQYRRFHPFRRSDS